MWPIVFVLFGCLCQFVHTSSRACPAAPPKDPSCLFRRISPGCQTDSDCKTTGTKCCVSDCGVLQCVNSIAASQCPPYRKDILCKRYDRQCSSKKDCKHGTICCPVDCGTACKLSVKPPGSEHKFCLHCCGPPPCCNTCGLPPTKIFR